MRFASGEEDRLARHHSDVVEHEGAERPDIRWELTVKSQNEVLKLALRGGSTAAFVSLYQFVQLGGEESLLCSHDSREQVLESSPLFRTFRVRGRRHFVEAGRDFLGNQSRKLWNIGQICSDFW